MSFPCLVSLLSAFALVSPAAIACSCSPSNLGACERAASATAIFTGRAISSTVVGNAKTFTFEVTTSFRGVQAQTIQVSSSVFGPACGTDFLDGIDYLVYAHQQEGRFSTGMCSGNMPVSKAAADLRYLRGAQSAFSKNARPPGYLFGYVSNRKSDLAWLKQPTWQIEGVKVTATAPDGSIAETSTREDGSYEFLSLPSGKYLVQTVPSVAFASSIKNEFAELKQGSCALVSFSGIERAELQGQLLDSGGVPVESGIIHLHPLGTMLNSIEVGTSTELESDIKDGKFLLNVPPGRYRIGSAKPDGTVLHYFPQEVTLNESSQTRLQLQLPKQLTKTLRGTVVDLNGLPQLNTKITINGTSPDGSITFGVIPNAEKGAFHFEVPDLEYEVIADFSSCPFEVISKVYVPKGLKGPVKLVLPLHRGACR